MAGYEDFCGTIAEAFTKCGKQPTVAGVEPGFYLYNLDEFTPVFSAANPIIVTGFTRLDPANVMYKLEGFGDNFNTLSKAVKKTVGPRFQETVMAYAASNSSAIKLFIYNGLVGRFGVVAINNDNQADGGFDLFGAISGLQFSENTQRDAADEDYQGAWKIELTNPSKVLEPLPPRSIMIPPAGSGTPPATYASTLAALEAFLAPAA